MIRKAEYILHYNKIMNNFQFSDKTLPLQYQTFNIFQSSSNSYTIISSHRQLHLTQTYYLELRAILSTFQFYHTNSQKKSKTSVQHPSHPLPNREREPRGRVGSRTNSILNSDHDRRDGRRGGRCNSAQNAPALADGTNRGWILKP